MKTQKEKAKVIKIFLDFETMPNLVRTWRKWEQNVIWYERYSYIWSISYGYEGSDKVYHKNITDFPLYKKDKYSDEALVKFVWDLLTEADIVVAHNGNAFDLKLITGRFAHYKLGAPSPYKQVDTKLLFKKYFNEDSNSLKDICLKHGLPHKLETGGEKLWEDCEKGDKKAIAKMRWYNNGDIVSLKAAYYFVLPFCTQLPNIGIMIGERSVCPNCGSNHLQSRGIKYGKRNWYCVDCRSWHYSAIKEGSQVR